MRVEWNVRESLWAGAPKQRWCYTTFQVMGCRKCAYTRAIKTPNTHTYMRVCITLRRRRNAAYPNLDCAYTQLAKLSYVFVCVCSKQVRSHHDHNNNNNNNNKAHHTHSHTWKAQSNTYALCVHDALNERYKCERSVRMKRNASKAIRIYRKSLRLCV